jgi:two-component system, cell cycle sensor histidine kinase and response regulator CckA
VNELALRMEEMLRRLIGEDIELVAIAAASEDAVEADTGRIEQVIMNLVVNSRDAMPGAENRPLRPGLSTWANLFAADGVEPGRYVAITIAEILRPKRKTRRATLRTP